MDKIKETIRKLSLLLMSLLVLISHNNCSKMSAVNSLDFASSCSSTKISKLEDEKTLLTGFFFFHVSISTGEDAKDKINYFLKMEDGSKVSIQTQDQGLEALIPAKARVRMSGRMVNDQFQLDPFVKKSNGSYLYPFEVLSNPEVQFGVQMTTGQQQVLALIADFSAGDNACSSAQVNNLLFSDNLNSMKNYYQVASRGNLDFAGQVAQPIRINENNPRGQCTSQAEIENWKNQLKQGAENQGLNTANFDKILYFFPIGGCGSIGGQAENIPGDEAWMWHCNSNTAPTVINHEMGHLLGMWHAGKDATRIANSYRDHSDIMGNGGVFQLNGAHTYQMEWTPKNSIIEFDAAREIANTDVELSPLDIPTDRNQVIRIKDQDRFFYISYRKTTGEPYTPNTNSRQDYLDKVNMHEHPVKLDDLSFTAPFTWFRAADTTGRQIRGSTFTATIETLGESSRVHLDFLNASELNCRENPFTLEVRRNGAGLNDPTHRSVELLVKNHNVGQSCGAEGFLFSVRTPQAIETSLPFKGGFTVPAGYDESLIIDFAWSKDLPYGTYPIDFLVEDSDGNTSEIPYQLIVDGTGGWLGFCP